MSALPSSLLHSLERVPKDRPVALLLRHSARDSISSGEVGNDLPITELGRRLAVELGAVIGAQLQTLRCSPLLRCTQTAEAIRVGARVELPIAPDRLLGHPGVFVVDDARAWENWKLRGHVGVIEQLVLGADALPGMAQPDEAARSLVVHMLAVAGDVRGVHVFISHDSIVAPTVARLLDLPLGPEEWPSFLEGAFFWHTQHGVRVDYRGMGGERGL